MASQNLVSQAVSKLKPFMAKKFFFPVSGFERLKRDSIKGKISVFKLRAKFSKRKYFRKIVSGRKSFKALKASGVRVLLTCKNILENRFAFPS
ncbi:MAG: hypothetical protein QM426_05285 [Euryarchaeota archaeon]|nr:hypothetical protein [Euryarchaeota archaeon]